MLTPVENEFISRVGPGTPMGALFRRFWLPALLASELPSPDCPPVRVRLLGEDLVAFKDSDGKVALLDAHCPHRLADLFFGRNEECGLRCVYHGWKFDVNGDCVDMPNEPAESNFKSKVRTTAYPAIERGGVIWTYMGPREVMPDLPAMEWSVVPESHRHIDKFEVGANYLQTVEGDIDNSHVSFLHSYLDVNSRQRSRSASIQQSLAINRLLLTDTSPKVTVKDTDYGIMIGWRRTLDEENYYWRITHWLMPGYSFVGAPEPGQTVLCNARVPIDDERSWFFRIEWNPTRPLTPEELYDFKFGGVVYAEKLPGTFKAKANKENDYLIDRALQRSYNYTGIRGTNEQDQAVVEGMGPIVDRSKEHLGTSDTAIIAMRRKLIRAARDLEAGIEPVAAANPAAYGVRSCGAVLHRDVPFDQGARDRILAEIVAAR
jgi:nitrite reductase/ring-hydroxylating ferredoxin subunit